MNYKFYLLACLAITLFACNKNSSEVSPTRKNTYAAPHTAARESESDSDSDGGDHSLFITTNEANTMISSYIRSLKNNPAIGTTTSPDVRSFSIDADSLREYLSDPSIKNIKLVFAHTIDYIKAGNDGQYAGMQAGAITIVIAGYKENGEYVYHNGNYVLDHCVPCPFSCPAGAAGNELLQ